MWPHLWSLDAPLVAVVWQHWWAHAARVNLPLSRDITLGLAVWLIYLADRLADVARAGPLGWPEYGTARHAFYARARRAASGLVLVLSCALTVLTPMTLSAREFGMGLGMLGAAGGYFWLAHRWSAPRWTAILPKEAAVGGLFALGTALFVLCCKGRADGELVTLMLMTAVVFALNCALISRWEACERDRRDPSSLQNAFPRMTAQLGRVGLWLAVAAGGVALLVRSDSLLPVAVSAGGLALLDLYRNRFSADALRVLADLMLLTPVCFLLVST